MGGAGGGDKCLGGAHPALNIAATTAIKAMLINFFFILLCFFCNMNSANKTFVLAIEVKVFAASVFRAAVLEIFCNNR